MHALESGRGALVEGGRISGVRRLSPVCRCPSLHIDHVPPPRASNPACGFPTLGSRSRSCSCLREAGPSAVPSTILRLAPGKRTSSRTPPPASGPATDAAIVVCRIDPWRCCGLEPDRTVANRWGTQFSPVPATVSAACYRWRSEHGLRPRRITDGMSVAGGRDGRFP